MSTSQASHKSIMDSGVDVGMGCLSSLVDETSPPNFKYDPLISQGRFSPPEFARFEQQEPMVTIDFTSPTKMYIEDSMNSNMAPFMDMVPDTMLESFNSSIASSIIGDENPFEVFQDLRHTSTPKQAIATTIEKVECSQARKRIKFGDGSVTGRSVSWHVLRDITSHNIMPFQSDSFIKISDSFTKRKPDESTVPETPVIRKIPILRGNNRRNSVKASVSGVESAAKSTVKDFLFPNKNPSIREIDKWLYYTGFTNYDLMVKVLSHISVPSEGGLSPFQIVIMTLMKLKCDLDWGDLSHRFQLFEPVVFRLFHSTLSLLSYSLSDVIPWTLPPLPRPNITIFLYPLSFRSDTPKTIIIFLTDSRCPVLYVSDPLPCTQEPLSLIPLLSHYFNTDDQVCIRGMSRRNNPTFLRLVKSENKITYNYVEYKNCNVKERFLKSVTETLRSMRQYKILLSKTPVAEANMKHLVNVICSLVNIRTSELICDSTLKNIYKRSYRAPYAVQSLV